MRFQRMWLLAGACVLAAGCDIPTDPPIIEQRWVLPLEVVSLDQGELLPASVTIAGDFYDVGIDPVDASDDLLGLCPACAPLHGQTVPTPAFNGMITSSDALPTDIVSAAVASGSIDISISNGLSFDPLFNGGTITITVADDDTGDVFGQVVFDGATETIAPSSVAMKTMILTSQTITTGIRTTVDVDHVGGEVATIDVTDVVQVTATTSSMLMSAVTVAVDGLSASLSDEPLDVDDLDTSIIDRIQDGAVVLEVNNPFGVTFAGSIEVGPVTKSVSIPGTATSEVTLDFTGQQLRDILNDPNATFSGSGTIGGGPVTVTPADELSIDPTIDLTIEIGG